MSRRSHLRRTVSNNATLGHFRARYFDAELGRFLNRDPLGCVDGASLYQGYFAVNGVDPSGQDFYHEGGGRPIAKEPGSVDEWPEEFPVGGIGYEDWFNWWIEYVDKLDADRKDAFKETLKTGCIGVCATVSGFSEIDEFRKSLTNCYKSQAAAEKAAKGIKCGEGKDCYECDRGPRIIALQFSSRAVVHGQGGDVNEAWKKMPEPINLATPANWAVVNTAYDDQRNIITEYFDFQIFVPGQDCWLGANNGEAPNLPMKVLQWKNKDLPAHIAKGVKRGQNLQPIVSCVRSKHRNN